jgi:hypothetical protein
MVAWALVELVLVPSCYSRAELGVSDRMPTPGGDRNGVQKVFEYFRVPREVPGENTRPVVFSLHHVWRASHVEHAVPTRSLDPPRPTLFGQYIAAHRSRNAGTSFKREQSGPKLDIRRPELVIRHRDSGRDDFPNVSCRRGKAWGRILRFVYGPGKSVLT